MANKRVKPENKRVISPFTLPVKLKIQLEEICDRIDIPMSRFVEQAITEKIKNMDQNNVSENK